jgi:quinol monooxygenase YgiN
MEKLALLVTFEAKAGKEEELAAFLKSALPLAQAEIGTLKWYGLRLSPTKFGIFDTFANDTDRSGHLSGPIAAALMEKAPDLLAGEPTIEQVELLTVK